MEIITAIILYVVGFFARDYLKNILPCILLKLAKNRFFFLKPKIRELVFKGFLNDLENEESFIKKYTMLIEFILTAKDVANPEKKRKRSIK